MVNINLLPSEIKIKIRQSKNNANVFSICLVSILIFGLITFALYELKNNYLSIVLKSSQDDVKKANESLKSFDKLQDEALFINDRAKISTDIEAKKPVWSQILQDLINSAPTDVQFTNLTADSMKTPNFVLQGNTTSEREAIKFKDKLENSEFFKDVAFKSSSTTGATGSVGVTPKLTFSLEFNLDRMSLKSVSTGGTK